MDRPIAMHTQANTQVGPGRPMHTQGLRYRYSDRDGNRTGIWPNLNHRHVPLNRHGQINALR